MHKYHSNSPDTVTLARWWDGQRWRESPDGRTTFGNYASIRRLVLA